MPLSQTLRKNSNVLWTISIVQDQNPDEQTKSEFSEMANDVLTTDTISKVTICLADNLQRYRLMIKDGLTEQEAIAQCQIMTAQWKVNNANNIQKLSEIKKLEFLTWEEFLSWPDKEATLEKLENWYKENREFRNDVDGRVRQAAANIGNDAKITNPVQQTELLKKYLFEECAFQKFAASKGFDYELYKTPFNKAMRRVKNNTDFVPRGFMVETHFTQFNPALKKLHKNGYTIHQEKESFSPVFNKIPINPATSIELSISVKFSEFIEKTLQMLPPYEQKKAVEALMKFTAQEILPLYYSSNASIKL